MRKREFDQWKAWIPQYIPNRLFLAVYNMLAWLPVSKGIVFSNAKWNEKMLNEHLFSTVKVCDGFIEEQERWKEIRFGKTGNIRDSGCGVLAVYNALHALKALPGGQEISTLDKELLLHLISSFEIRGAAWQGYFGIPPRYLASFLKKSGYRVQMYAGRKARNLDEFGQEGDVFIATVFNDIADITRQLHTVCITKKGGRFIVHNGAPARRSESSGGGQVGFPNLSEAVTQISQYGAVPILLIKVRQKQQSN